MCLEIDNTHTLRVIARSSDRNQLPKCRYEWFQTQQLSLAEHAYFNAMHSLDFLLKHKHSYIIESMHLLAETQPNKC